MINKKYIKKLIKMSNELDERKLTTEADFLDKIIANFLEYKNYKIANAEVTTTSTSADSRTTNPTTNPTMPSPNVNAGIEEINDISYEISYKDFESDRETPKKIIISMKKQDKNIYYQTAGISNTYNPDRGYDLARRMFFNSKQNTQKTGGKIINAIPSMEVVEYQLSILPRIKESLDRGDIVWNGAGNYTYRIVLNPISLIARQGSKKSFSIPKNWPSFEAVINEGIKLNIPKKDYLNNILQDSKKQSLLESRWNIRTIKPISFYTSKKETSGQYSGPAWEPGTGAMGIPLFYMQQGDARIYLKNADKITTFNPNDPRYKAHIDRVLTNIDSYTGELFPDKETVRSQYKYLQDNINYLLGK